MTDIKSYSNLTKIEPISKGWSSDKKYYIETADDKIIDYIENNRYLLDGRPQCFQHGM